MGWGWALFGFVVFFFAFLGVVGFVGAVVEVWRARAVSESAEAAVDPVAEVVPIR